jgi:hypothetical protein
MSDRRNGAFFFLLRQAPMPSLDELATAAGMTALDPRPLAVDRGTDVRYGDWGGIESVRARVYHLSMHDCLAIDFLQSELLDLLPSPIDPAGNDPIPLEEDGALPVALAFRDTCERLHPEAAVMATHPHMLQDPEWLHYCYSAVLGMDPNLLDSYGPGLVYIGADMVDEWAPENYGPPQRDSLPVAEGRLLFRGNGWGRWF